MRLDNRCSQALILLSLLVLVACGRWRRIEQRRRRRNQRWWWSEWPSDVDHDYLSSRRCER